MIKSNLFYILRHGETEYQKEKKHRIYPAKGNLKSVRLTTKGRDQVKEAALKLKNENVSFIYSSDFLRTKQTSLIVARETGIARKNIVFDKRLRDINLGVYHGKLKEKFYQEMGNAPKDFNQRPEKGESLNQVSKRMVDFIKEIDKNHKKEKILIVSHGEPLWILEGFVKKRKKKDLIDRNFAKKNYIQTGELRKLKV